MTAFSAGQFLGSVVFWPILALGAMIWVAEFLDRYFRAWFEDYVLAVMSYLPLASLLVLGSYGNFIRAQGDAEILRAKVALGAMLVALFIGFAVRIAGVDEELDGHGTAKGDKPE